MRIQHNIMAINSYRNYTNNTNKLGGNLEKLSSGYRINRAGDDAAGLAISEKMRAQITGLDTAQKNCKDATSLVQTAEGALQEVHDMLNRMVELSTQAANGLYDADTDRANIQAEVDALLQEVDRIGKSSNFNGIYMFSNTYNSSNVKGALTLQVGASAIDTIKYQSFTLTATGAGTTMTALYALASSNSALAGCGTDGAMLTVSTANEAIETIQNAINFISAERGKLGALQNRLDHTLNNLGVMTENMTEAESTIRDTDVADEMMDYTKNNILIQSAQAMLAQANQVPQGVLSLMQ